MNLSTTEQAAELKLLQKAIKASLEAGKEILNFYNSEFELEFKRDNSPLTSADKASNKVIERYLQQTNIPILSEEGKSIPYNERKNWQKLWIVDPLDGTKEFINKNGEFTVNIALVENGIPIMGVIYLPVKKTLYFGSRVSNSFIQTNIEFQPDFEMDLNSPDLKKMPLPSDARKFCAVGSRSHMNQQTQDYFAKLEAKHGKIEVISKGSSIKFCMIAEGTADIYPRFGPTMEWDTAAGQAIVLFAGGKVTLTDETTPLIYNKENLLNPEFIVFP